LIRVLAFQLHMKSLHFLSFFILQKAWDHNNTLQATGTAGTMRFLSLITERTLIPAVPVCFSRQKHVIDVIPATSPKTDTACKSCTSTLPFSWNI